MINEKIFGAAHEQAQSIADSNERYTRLQADPLLADQPAFRQIAEEELRQEQTEQFTQLKELDLSPYDALAAEYSDALSMVTDAQERVDDAHQQIETEQGRYSAILTALKKYAPRSEGRAFELANDHMSTYADSILSEPRAELTVQQARLAAIDELYVAVGQAWPVPQLIDRRPIYTKNVVVEETPIEETVKLIESQVPVETHEQPAESSADETLAEDATKERDTIAADHELVRRIEAGKIAAYVSSDGAGQWQAHLATLPEGQREHAISAVTECLADGTAANSELYERFHRLVRHIANKVYTTLPPGPGLEADDVYQLGWEFLEEQVARYAEAMPDRPLRVQIANFMDRSIRARAYQELFAISLPADMNMKVGQVIRGNQERLNHRRPIMSDEDIAELTGFPVQARRARQRTVEDIHNAIRQTRLMGSLDRGLSPGADFSLGDSYTMKDILVDPNDEDEAFMRLSHDLLQDALQGELKTLSERESEIITMYYGLDGSQPKTLDEIGLVYGKGRERIRQIHSKAMAKLRHPSRSDSLRDFALQEESDKAKSQTPDNLDERIKSQQAMARAKGVYGWSPIDSSPVTLERSVRAPSILKKQALEQAVFWAALTRKQGNRAASAELVDTINLTGQLRNENTQTLKSNAALFSEVITKRREAYEHVRALAEAAHTNANPSKVLQIKSLEQLAYAAIEQVTHAAVNANAHNNYNYEALYGWTITLQHILFEIR